LRPVGVAARTAATVADALGIFSAYMAAYRPVIRDEGRAAGRPASAMQ